MPLWSPLNALVDLDTAKQHINRPMISPDPQDDDLELKLYMAHEVVIDFVSQRLGDTAATWAEEVAAWTTATAPARVKGAILAQYAFLARWRGDDEEEPRTLLAGDEAIAPRAKALVLRYKDPTVA